METDDWAETFDIGSELWVNQPAKALTPMVEGLWRAYELQAEAKAELGLIRLEFEMWEAAEMTKMMSSNAKLANWKAETLVKAHQTYQTYQQKIIKLEHRLERCKNLVQTLIQKMQLMRRFMDMEEA